MFHVLKLKLGLLGHRCCRRKVKSLGHARVGPFCGHNVEGECCINVILLSYRCSQAGDNVLFWLHVRPGQLPGLHDLLPCMRLPGPGGNHVHHQLHSRTTCGCRARSTRWCFWGRLCLCCSCPGSVVRAGPSGSSATSLVCWRKRRSTSPTLSRRGWRSSWWVRRPLGHATVTEHQSNMFFFNMSQVKFQNFRGLMLQKFK